MKIKERLTNKDAWIRYRDSLRYALHCIVRPFDGFWDLTHEKRGSMAAANTIVILVLLTNLIKLGATSFVFNPVNWDNVNLILEIATFLVPVSYTHLDVYKRQHRKEFLLWITYQHPVSFLNIPDDS